MLRLVGSDSAPGRAARSAFYGASPTRATQSGSAKNRAENEETGPASIAEQRQQTAMSQNRGIGSIDLGTGSTGREGRTGLGLNCPGQLGGLTLEIGP